MIYEFAATQDLHGYDEPWAPGEGKNKCPDILYQSSADSVWIGGDEYPFYLTAGETYTLSFICDKETNIYIKQDTASVGTKIATGSHKATVTITETGYYRFAVHKAGGLLASDISNPQLEIGDKVTPYAPYSNICPPEGYDIWDPSSDQFIQVYAGYVNANTRELYLRPVYKEYAGEELVGPWMSSLDPYDEDTTPTEGAFVIDFGGELESFEITPFMLQTLLDSLGIRQHFTNGAGLLNSLMDQAQGRVRSEEELLHLSRPLNVITIGDQLPAGLTFKPISKDVLPGLPGKFIR